MRRLLLFLSISLVFVLPGCSLIESGPGNPIDPDPIPEPAPVPVDPFSAPFIIVQTDNADGYADFQAEITISNKQISATNQWSTNDGADWIEGELFTVFSACNILSRSISTNGEISPTNSDTVRFFQAPVFDTQWGSRGYGEGELYYPFGIAIEGGEIFVAEGINNRIQVFDTNGNSLRMWGVKGDAPGELFTPHGLFIHSKLLYVADYDNNRIQIFDLQGNFIKQWGSEGTADGQFTHPYDVYVSGGEVFVTDFMNHRLQVFDTNGVFLRTWGKLGFDVEEYNFASGIWVYQDQVYVGDRLNDRIQIYDLQGNYLRLISGLSGPLDIFVHHDRLYVTEYANRISVLTLSPDNSPITTWGVPGRDPGEIKLPSSIAFSDNAVYVTDTMNNTIHRYVW